MSFLEKTLRDWKVTLEPMAAPKPGQLKVTSEAEARPTPTTMGRRDTMMSGVGLSFRKIVDSSTEKKGSMACTPSKLT